MMDGSGEPVRTLLRAIFMLALLLGGGGHDWTLGQTAPQGSCCCGTPVGMEDACPCPKPEGNRGSQRGACADRQTLVVNQASRRGEQGQRRTEPHPQPAVRLASQAEVRGTRIIRSTPGRDPDLGRHLARLNTLRI